MGRGRGRGTPAGGARRAERAGPPHSRLGRRSAGAGLARGLRPDRKRSPRRRRSLPAGQGRDRTALRSAVLAGPPARLRDVLAGLAEAAGRGRLQRAQRRGQDRLRPAAQSHRVRPGVARARRYAGGSRWRALLPFADTLRLLQEDRHDRKRVGSARDGDDADRGRPAGRGPDAGARRRRPTRRRRRHPAGHHAGDRVARRRRRSTRSAPCSPTGTRSTTATTRSFPGGCASRSAVSTRRSIALRGRAARAPRRHPAGRAGADHRRPGARRRACAPTWRSR